MKRALGILLTLVMILSIGMASAATLNTRGNPGTDLTSIGYFTKEDRIIEGNSTHVNATDSFGNTYASLIYSDTEEGMIEYRLGGAYETLEATVYIPTYALQNGWDHMWDTATISIYADNQFVGTISGFTSHDAPLPIEIDVEDVQFLRFEFDDVCFYYMGRANALAVIGNPTLY